MHYSSQYNHFTSVGDQIVGYNARTGSFAVLKTEIAAELAKNSGFASSDPELTNELLELGFIHTGDEKEQIAARYEKGRNAGHLLHLTILPTIACDRACDYCFQDHYRTDKTMSADTQQNLIRFVAWMISQGKREIACSWFGGEPLLAPSVVLGVGRSLRELSERSGCVLNQNIITNGTRLSPEIAQQLREQGITSAQVTFDALVDNGVTRRGVQTRDGDPSLIMRNLLSTMHILKIVARVNVDKLSTSEVDSIVDYLKTSGFGESFYLARVHNFEHDTGFVTNKEGERRPDPQSRTKITVNGKTIRMPPANRLPTTITRRDFAALESKFLTGASGLNAIMRKLTPKGHFCSATKGIMYVIDPSGDVSRCWHSAGSKSEAIGSINDSGWEPGSDTNTMRWLGYTPFRYESCGSCRVLPLCMGGCSHNRIFMDASSPPCEAIKFQIDECVRIAAHHLVEEKPS